MPIQPFKVYTNTEETLIKWSRTLNYIFGNLDSANIPDLNSIASSDIAIADAGGFYSSTSVEGALQEVIQSTNYPIPASTYWSGASDDLYKVLADLGAQIRTITT